MQFPALQSFLAGKKRTPQAQQQQYPGLYQAMPTVPSHLTPQESGMERQAGFNKQQEEMNKGMIGGKMNRRSF
jgi:hypothetical protein